MTDRELMQQAMDALENVYGKGKRCEAAITALRARLAQPRQWQSLTDEEIQTAWASMNHDPAAFVHFAAGALWAEAKLKENNR